MSRTGEPAVGLKKREVAGDSFLLSSNKRGLDNGEDIRVLGFFQGFREIPSC